MFLFWLTISCFVFRVVGVSFGVVGGNAVVLRLDDCYLCLFGWYGVV